MNPRIWTAATIGLGLVSIAIVLTFSTLPEVRIAYPNGDFALELGRFQRAVSMADLASVFGDPADPAKLQAMSAGNTLDLFAFIPAYTLFLVAGALMLGGGPRAPLSWLSIVPTLFGAGGDIIETTHQLAVTADYANAASQLPIALWCWVKFFGLAFGALGVSAICFLGPRERWVLGAIGFLPLIVTLGDFLELIHAPTLMTLGDGGFWVALILVGFREMVRKDPA
jgi:hypothetical protein